MSLNIVFLMSSFILFSFAGYIYTNNFKIVCLSKNVQHDFCIYDFVNGSLWKEFWRRKLFWKEMFIRKL